MKKSLILIFLLSASILKSQTKEDSLFIRKIYDQALTGSRCYEVLEHLCTQIPSRLSGSHGAALAVEYMNTVMKDEKFSRVFLQEVMVPHWERGSICRVKSNQKGVAWLCICGRIC